MGTTFIATGTPLMFAYIMQRVGLSFTDNTSAFILLQIPKYQAYIVLERQLLNIPNTLKHSRLCHAIKRYF